jgi:aspartokinase/homoserine dehydrogenase 1
MKVLKFGGSSLATPAIVRQAARILLTERRREPILAVVSAFQGVTDQLIECAQLAEHNDPRAATLFDQIGRRHRHALAQLTKRRSARHGRSLEALLSELESTIHGIQLLRHCPPRALDMTASFGERLSALIMTAHLESTGPAVLVDARQFIVTDDQFTHANVLFKKTYRRARAHFDALFRRSRRVIPVVTGFIGATEDGQTTTIGRNGSDYSAAIVGAAVNASVIEIWTDVDGVLTADPKVVPSAFVLREMTYEEAMELSYFGAKVLHSATIAPAVAKGIPILIKNTFHPEAPGTRISKRVAKSRRGSEADARAGGARRVADGLGEKRGDGDRLASGISSVGDLALLTLKGPAMVGVPGVAERLFRTLAARRVNVILISQASSEHTICFAVRNADAARAVEAIEQEFRLEFHEELMNVDVRSDQAILAVVGEGMKGRPGVAGKVFDALGKQNINISAIAQGASERNISCVIDEHQEVRALNAIHHAFFEVRRRLALAVIGVGNVGGAVLRQLHQQRSYLMSRGFDVKVVGLANSRRFVVAPRGIDLDRWDEALSGASERMDPVAFARRIAQMELTNAALVDCTAGPAIVDAYGAFIDANLHIVTPNKWANALPWRRYAALMDLLERRQRHFLFEANVGAGLPIVSTLRDLIASGDEVVKVEGVLSGTLSYLFNTFDGSVPFSELVGNAHRMGFTEPDPREDLSGLDVARKLLILARQIGLKMELRDVQTESLVPRRLTSGKYSGGFLKAFARYDRQIGDRVARAASRGAVLRYVGTLDRGKARAGLKEFPRDHPVASAKASDNLIAFTTRRYATTPLVVQGPGAGADVTAMGVFSDILKLLNYLP